MAVTLPISNRFKEFNNMTYSTSIYIQSPAHYKSMIDNNVKSVKGLKLLIQSGGINDSNINESTSGDFGATRSTAFKNDFYLDNIQFKGLISGGATGAAHNSFELNFNVVEPMGITFLESLNAAITEYNKTLNGENNINFISQTYLMVVRFYGYDENGKQILGSDTGNSDSAAFTEKWIPFMFKNITFRLEADKVVYSCTAVPPSTLVPNDQIHGTVPFNIALQGQTVEQLLNGSSASNASPPSGGVITLGLTEALNNHQTYLAKNEKYLIADEYAIEFEKDSEIAKAKLAAPGTTLINRTGMPGGVDQAALIKSATGDAKSIKGVKSYAINAGIKIMTFLDMAIRTSTFISDQYKATNDTNADGSTKFKKKTTDPLKWFKINTRAELKGYDKLRNTWAYKIVYVISEYEVRSVSTHHFDQLECIEPHKEYDHWFTGKNTEILNFVQDFDFLYYTTFGSKSANESTPDTSTQINARAMKAFRVNSNQTGQGDENATAEQAANAASELYSPADQAKVELDIVGDPDWIGQSELFYGAKAEKNNDLVLPDGSINYDRAEIYFAINFNTVVDYDITTGVADVTNKNVGKNPTANPGGYSQYSIIYRANIITTELSGGKFTQRLEGTLVYVPDKCLKKADDVSREDPAVTPPTSSSSDTGANTMLKSNEGVVTMSPGSSTSGEESDNTPRRN